MGRDKSGSNNRVALLSEVIYLISKNGTTKSGSIKRRELVVLTEVLCMFNIWKTILDT